KDNKDVRYNVIRRKEVTQVIRNVCGREKPALRSYPPVNSLAHLSGGVGGENAGFRFARTCSLRPIPMSDVVIPGAERANWIAFSASVLIPRVLLTTSGKSLVNRPWYRVALPITATPSAAATFMADILVPIS